MDHQCPDCLVRHSGATLRCCKHEFIAQAKELVRAVVVMVSAVAAVSAVVAALEWLVG